MIFLYLNIIFSHSKDSDTDHIKIDSGKLYILPESDLKTKGTDYGFVTSYSGDTKKNTEFFKIYVLGYNLFRFCPQYDRILIIPTTFQLPHHIQTSLSTFWNVVFRINHPYFNCSSPLRSLEDLQIWFRLSSFRLTSYKKLIWCDPNSVFVNSPNSLFEYQTPAAPADHSSWGLSQFGVVRNYGLFIFKPSLKTYHKLLEKACNWIEFPHVRAARISYRLSDQNLADWEMIGGFDAGLIEETIGTKMRTLPWFTQMDAFGSTANSSQADPRIISFRFDKKTQPWNGTLFAHSAWSEIADEALSFRGISIGIKRKATDKNSDGRRTMRARMQHSGYPLIRRYYIESDNTNFSVRNVALRSIALLVISVGIFLYAITFPHNLYLLRKMRRAKKASPKKQPFFSAPSKK